MKKIILILALLSLGVSKAQVVGGYLPLNSTKSATMGGLKVAGNETVTGTFSVGSTATVTGGLRVTGASTIGTGQNNYFGAIISSQLESTSNGYINNKLRVGNNTTPSATLDVTGTLGVSSTFSLGSANLTGGNTGTVAVLSDAKFTLYNAFAPSNLAASTTYHFGAIALSSAPNTSQNTRYNVIPQNCTLSGFSINYYNVTQGSSGTSTVDIIVNNSTVTTLTTVSQPANFGAGLIDTYYSSSLTTTLSAGDKYELRLTTPAFSVVPTSCQMDVVLYLTPR